MTPFKCQIYRVDRTNADPRWRGAVSCERSSTSLAPAAQSGKGDTVSQSRSGVHSPNVLTRGAFANLPTICRVLAEVRLFLSHSNFYTHAVIERLNLAPGACSAPAARATQYLKRLPLDCRRPQPNLLVV